MPALPAVPPSVLRRCGALACGLVLVGGLAACGSDSGSATTAAGAAGANGPGGGFRGFAQDPKVAACLKKAGVSIPTRPRNGQGAPPANGTPPTGTPPAGGRPGFGGQTTAERAKFQAALKACGVTLPQGRPGAGGGVPPTGTGTGSGSTPAAPATAAPTT